MPIALAVAIGAAAPAGAAPAVSGPPNALLNEAPATLAPGPSNGAFAAGLEGWTALGREDPPLVGTARGPAARLLRNTTLISPPFAVPAGAQALAVTARAPGVGAALEVRARPVEGGADVPLGALEPGNPFRTFQVGLPGLAGRTVRIVLDPVEALGRAIDVAAVGPVTAPLPGWDVLQGVPQPARRGRRQALVVREDPLELASPRFARGAGARFLLVAVRGSGRVRLDAGARRVTAVAGGAWRDVRVPLPRRASSARLGILASPDGGTLELRDLGLVVRATGEAGLRARRAGRGRAVTGRLVPAGAGLAVELRTVRGRPVARGRTDARGGFRLRAPAAGALVLSTAGDRTRLPGRWRVRG
ncbi:MAG: hypothetical protein QOD86_1059 [Miltoncostaeaceae bacterium]|nr:hypothetical protein [Miltoncostaeaceae bacterium]